MIWVHEYGKGRLFNTGLGMIKKLGIILPSKTCDTFNLLGSQETGQRSE